MFLTIFQKNAFFLTCEWLDHWKVHNSIVQMPYMLYFHLCLRISINLYTYCPFSSENIKEQGLAQDFCIALHVCLYGFLSVSYNYGSGWSAGLSWHGRSVAQTTFLYPHWSVRAQVTRLSLVHPLVCFLFLKILHPCWLNVGGARLCVKWCFALAKAQKHSQMPYSW